MRTSIFTRIFLGFAFVISVFVLPVIILIITVMQDRVVANILDENRVLAVRFVSEVSSKISEAERTLLFSIHELEDHNLAASKEKFEKFFYHQDSFEEMAFLDESGREIFKFSRKTGILAKDLKNRAAEEIFQKAISGLIFVGQPQMVSPQSGDYYIEMATPYEIRPGFYEGVIVGKKNLADIASLFSSGAAAGKNFYVVDAGGSAIIHSDKSKAAGRENLSDLVPAAAALKGESGSAVFENAGGTKYFSGFAFVPEAGWGVIIEEKSSDALAEANLARDLMILLSFLFLLVGFLVFLLISRGVSSSLGELVRSVLFFKEFKRPVDVVLEKPSAIKEIDFLAKEFRKMCFDIRDSLDLLSAEKNKLQAIFENAGEGIFVVDKEEKFKTLNKTAENLLGWTEKEIAGKAENEFLKILDDKKQSVHKDGGCLPNDVWKKGKSAAFNNFSFLKKDGGRIVVDLSVAPILDGAKKPAAGIFLFRDVSEFYKVEKVKTEFITVASHQLRTPLTATKWFLELALGEKPDKKMKTFLKNAYDSNERIIALLADLLSAARLETSEIVPDSASADLTGLAKLVAAEQEEKIKKKKIKLSFKIAGGKAADFKVKIDERFLRQAIANLLTNAIMYTPAEGKIAIILEKKGREAVFAVKDTGYGIPKNEQKMIFQKFFRGTNVFKKETQGTGLGLYIVKAILEIFGGKIWFESEENKGTTFYFTLPLAEK